MKGEVVNLCPHGQTAQMCAECRRQAAIARARAKHPSGYQPEDDAA